MNELYLGHDTAQHRATPTPTSGSDHAGGRSPARGVRAPRRQRSNTRACAAYSADNGLTQRPELDLRDVRGQIQAKRALTIAAAGGHSILMRGPPGPGKSMLAMRLPGLLPPMTETESLEVAAIASASGIGFNIGSFGRRPMRTPHHTASAVSLVGGGSVPRPGEISLAHHGVLFLDELLEYDRRALEALREPLERVLSPSRERPITCNIRRNSNSSRP